MIYGYIRVSTKRQENGTSLDDQLRILKQSKLVKYKRLGNQTYYQLADEHVEKIFRIGCEHINEI